MSMITTGTLIVVAKLLGRELPNAYHNMMESIDAEEIAGIASTHALGAAAASLAAGWIPGAGGVAALLASGAFIWSMYYRINTACGIRLDKNILKSLGSAILTNIVTQVGSLVAGTVVASVLSFFPGIGTAAAELIMASVVFATVIAAAVMYMKMMTRLLKAGQLAENMSADDLKAAAAKTAKEVDVKGVVQEAQKAYTQGKKSGVITGKETTSVESFE